MLGWELPPHHTGGMGIACYQMCKHLARNGIDIEFLLPFTAQFNIDFMKVTAAHPQSFESVEQAGGIYDSSYFRLTKHDGTSRVVNMNDQQEMYEASVESIAFAKEFDIIHAHDWLTFRAAIAAKRASGKPMIAHVHATEYDRSGGTNGNPLVREIEYNGMLMADRIVAVSQATKNTIVREYGIPADKIEVVHNSIEADPSDTIAEGNVYTYLDLMKRNGHKVVLSLGRLTIQKGLTYLMESARLVVEREPKTLFLFVGNGDQYQELIELAAEMGISKNVIFTGFQRGRYLFDAFRVANVFVMPSVSEPFGLTPLEAALQCTPSIISKQSGVSEVMQNCLKVDYWDTHKLADDIVGIVRNDALEAELTQNAARELQRMTWGDAAKKLVNVYENHHAGATA